MKVPRRDYLTIAAALLAILLCGYGVGFLVGERTTQNRLRPGGGAPPPRQAWETATLERLSTELDLSPQQRQQVGREILAASKTINRARLDAVLVYRRELLDLHLRLLPYLNDEQRARIEESSRRLQKMLDAGP